MKFVAGIITFIAAVGAVAVGPVEAGPGGPIIFQGPLTGADGVTIYANFDDPTDELDVTPAVAAAATQLELFDSTGGAATDLSENPACAATAPWVGFPIAEASVFTTCTGLTAQAYRVGISGNSPFSVVSVNCYQAFPIFTLPTTLIQNEPIDGTAAEFDNDTISDLPWVCVVKLRPPPTIYIDKVFVGDDDGGPATASDITLEVYDDEGTLLSGPALADPSDDQCFSYGVIVLDSAETVDALVDDTICAAMQVPPGDYTLGEVLPDYGYVASSLECEPIDFFGMMMVEILPSPAFPTVEHGLFGGSDTLCTLTNEYITQEVTVDLVVDNSPGGASATGDQFTIEVFDNTGTKVDEGVDPEPGTGNAQYTFTLPIGPYTFGVSGPDGYDASVVITPQELPRDIIADDTAGFTLSRFTTVTAAITVTAPAPAPTTTTTTTTTTLPPAPTTAAPAPTTTIAAVLPETGPSSSTPTLLLMALALLLFGGGTVLATRRH